MKRSRDLVMISRPMDREEVTGHKSVHKDRGKWIARAASSEVFRTIFPQ
jgi:hypothetical protein